MRVCIALISPLEGSASHLYRVSYSYISGGNELTLLSEGEQPPVPLLSSATFSDDGTYISVLFDSSHRIEHAEGVALDAVDYFHLVPPTNSCIFVSDIECLVSLFIRDQRYHRDRAHSPAT